MPPRKMDTTQTPQATEPTTPPAAEPAKKGPTQKAEKRGTVTESIHGNKVYSY